MRKVTYGILFATLLATSSLAQNQDPDYNRNASIDELAENMAIRSMRRSSVIEIAEPTTKDLEAHEKYKKDEETRCKKVYLLCFADLNDDSFLKKNYCEDAIKHDGKSPNKEAMIAHFKEALEKLEKVDHQFAHHMFGDSRCFPPLNQTAQKAPLLRHVSGSKR